MAIKTIKYGGMVAGKEERKALIKSIDKAIATGNWQQGEEGALLEQEAAKFLGVKYGVLTTSGSCAGLLALSALELPRGSEVIISAVTFPTIFNIILQCGLVPVVVDAKVGTYNFDVRDVEDAITEKTGAIIAIHAVGNPVDMPSVMKMVSKYSKKIYVIEDNCDGWGGTINGQRVGSFGDVSITSFHAAHIVSMGVGGGVFTSDKGLAGKVRQYRDWGRQATTDKPHTCSTLPADYNPRFVYDKIGYNFQILELQAAMGRVQLKKSESIKELRRKNLEWIVKKLDARFPGKFVMPKVVRGAKPCWFSIPLTYIGNRGKLVAHLEANGIETRSMFAGNITKHPAYEDAKYRISGRLAGANYILQQSFWIGCHPRMTNADREYVIEVFADYFKKNGIPD
jgi:CDP-6-deoxy-D-xylo-4-hexulose-3-dehydrase